MRYPVLSGSGWIVKVPIGYIHICMMMMASALQLVQHVDNPQLATLMHHIQNLTQSILDGPSPDR